MVKNFMLMEYDERSQTPKRDPSPAPSMMTIVPVSRWKNSYSMMIPKQNVLDYLSYFDGYVNVISPNLSNVLVSINNAAPVHLSSLGRLSGFNNFSKNFPGFAGAQYSLPGSFNITTLRLYSTEPFIAYSYLMGDFTIIAGHLGDTLPVNWHYEYAAPAGMQLNTGVTPSFNATTQQTCTGWHICVTDTAANDPGMKAAILIDDPDGVYWSTPAKFSNVSFDPNSPDYADGELHPHWHSNTAYCFDVNYTDPLSAAFAPMAIVDNLGNAIILQLTRSAPAVKLTTN